VLEEVGEARPPWLLVLRADVVPLVDVHDRELAIDVQDHLQTVRQGVLLELDVRNLAGAGNLAGGSRRGGGDAGEPEDGEGGEGGKLRKSGSAWLEHTYLLEVDPLETYDPARRLQTVGATAGAPELRASTCVSRIAYAAAGPAAEDRRTRCVHRHRRWPSLP
jgi:hypothetical protein